MTLNKVEKAFRSMKSDLGTRPIYHQTGNRTEAHLFISVIAYHLLSHIEKNLKKKNINHSWKTIRTISQTHQRSTVIITDTKGRIHHVRVSGIPEPAHEQIYKALNIKFSYNRKKFLIAKRL